MELQVILYAIKLNHFCMKLSIVKIISVMVVGIFLVGCSEEAPDHDESLFLQRSIYNWADFSSGRYEFDAIMDMSSADQGSISADLGINGAYSETSSGGDGGEMTVVAKVQDAENRDYRFDFALREVDKFSYVKLLDLPEIPNFPAAAFADFVGTWWQIDDGSMSEGFTGNTDLFGDLGTNFADLDESGKQLRELILTSRYFDNIQFEGTESVNGAEAYRYGVTSSSSGITEFLAEIAKIKGEEISAVAKMDFHAFLEMLTFEGDVWVDIEKSALVKLDMSAHLTDPSGEMDAEIVFILSDLGLPFQIDEPLEYEVFDLGMFFGAFMNSEVLGGMDGEEVVAPEAAAVPVVTGVE